MFVCSFWRIFQFVKIGLINKLSLKCKIDVWDTIGADILSSDTLSQIRHTVSVIMHKRNDKMQSIVKDLHSNWFELPTISAFVWSWGCWMRPFLERCYALRTTRHNFMPRPSFSLNCGDASIRPQKPLSNADISSCELVILEFTE